MTLSKKQKQTVRNSWRNGKFPKTHTNLRFRIAVLKEDIDIHKFTGNGKHIYKSPDSWQTKLDWVKNIVANRGKHASESFENYMIMHNGNEKLARELVSKKANRIKGSKNPGYQHGGKLSPWSKESKYYSEESKQSAAENRSHTTRLDYYTNRGLSNVEAIAALKQRQTTFTLEKCITKHGSIKGKEVWEERQRNWRISCENKSESEIREIRAKQATKINYSSLWGSYLDDPGILYIIQWEDNKNIKIGITSRGLEKRFRKSKRTYDVLYKMNDTISKCFEIEQIILRKHKILKTPDPDSHECFASNSFGDIFKSVQELKSKNYSELKELLREKFM